MPHLKKNYELGHNQNNDGVDFIDSKTIEEEKRKARSLRATKWWHQKISIGLCYYCQKKIPSQLLTMDHVVPLSKGGLSIKNNIVTSCKECNTSKKNQLVWDWKKE